MPSGESVFGPYCQWNIKRTKWEAEFDFRYSNRVANGFNDKERADEILMGVIGKRLTYQQAN
ncbi:MAG: hypothetical protein ACI9V0_003126 [Parasphingorhabdus sp.]|jgi:hypothetical protein